MALTWEPKKEDDEDEDNDFFFSLDGGGGVMHEMRGKATKMQGGGAGGFIRIFIRTCIALHWSLPNLVCCVLFHDFHLWGKHIHKLWAWTHTTPQPTQCTNTSAHHHYHQSSYYILKTWEKYLKHLVYIYSFSLCLYFSSFFLPFGYFLLSSFL